MACKHFSTDRQVSKVSKLKTLKSLSTREGQRKRLTQAFKTRRQKFLACSCAPVGASYSEHRHPLW
jgi:hypothetical protein